MELIPILIIVLGVVSSIISGKKNKEKEGDRNIDTSKLDKRGNAAPRSRQPDIETNKKEQKGFFQTLQEAFDEEFNPADTQSKQAEVRPQQASQQSAEGNRSTENRPGREASTTRPTREDIQNTRNNSSKNISDIKKRVTDRSKHAERASEAKQSGYSEGYSERVTKSEGIGKDIIDNVRYSYGDDVTQMHKRGQKESSSTKVKNGDLSFDRKAVVNGFIFSEILGKPKSKR